MIANHYMENGCFTIPRCFVKIPLKFTAFLEGLFSLYGNAVVSPFRPMGGELSFYLDIPSWELTKSPPNALLSR